MHRAAARRAQIDAPELVLRGRAALDQFALAALDLAQFLHHLGALVLVDLDDLEFDLPPPSRDAR